MTAMNGTDNSTATSWFENGMLHKQTCRTIPVSPAVAWEVVTDHAGYSDVADNLSRVEVVSGNGFGMCRRCYDSQGRGWNETCTLWEEGKAYAFTVDSGAPDYPYPLTELIGFFRVEPAAGGSRVTIEFIARPRWGIVGRLMLRFLMGPAERVCLRLLERWESVMVAKAAASAA